MFGFLVYHAVHAIVTQLYFRFLISGSHLLDPSRYLYEKSIFEKAQSMTTGEIKGYTLALSTYRDTYVWFLDVSC